LREIVNEHVDYYLDEYIEEMQVRTGKCVSIPTLWRSLAYCGITRKKVQFFKFKRNFIKIIVISNSDYYSSYIKLLLKEMNY
jgi:hypothetical protein